MLQTSVLLLPTLMHLACGGAADRGFGDKNPDAGSGGSGGVGGGGTGGSGALGGSGASTADASRPDSNAEDSGLPDANSDDSGPLTCTGTDQGSSAFARWPMPTDPRLNFATAHSLTVKSTIVEDNVTRLVWQRGSSPARLTHAEAVAYCQQLEAGACDDWRLPSMIELVSITDLSVQSPAINQVAFPNTPPDLFWTATPFAAGATEAWIVSFAYSDPNRDALTTSWYARCVRDPVVRGGGRYTLTTDTVSDAFTGLMWERIPSATERSDADAAAYCNAANIGTLDGWRLPTRNELLTVVDVTRHPTAIDTTVFGIPAAVNFFWSSSLDAGSARPWFVAFREGGIAFSDAMALAGVRCVR
jgi:hypothetical protein